MAQQNTAAVAGGPLNVVGKRAPNIDALERVTGRAKYTGDIDLPGMLVARVLRSTRPHARLVSIDTSKAEAIPGVRVYHAATAKRDGELVTAGGRVLTVVGQAAEFAEAIARAYAGVLQISFDGMQYRHDIGRKALQSPCHQVTDSPS